MTELAAAVLGNVNLDVICKTVADVPRHASIVYQQGEILPGGNGSNVALGLAQRGVDTALVARVGEDAAADLLVEGWSQAGIDLTWVEKVPGAKTGTSVVLVDPEAQPRFIYNPGANAQVFPGILEAKKLHQRGIRALHVAGYFVLPGLLDRGFPSYLADLSRAGIILSLDVVSTPAMEAPDFLWPCLPYLDYFQCNTYEAEILTGVPEIPRALDEFLERGARTVLVKAGEDGCWLANGEGKRLIPAPPVEEVQDTTGAGDAFAAGFLAALLAGEGPESACRAGNRAGAEATTHLGAVKLRQG